MARALIVGCGCHGRELGGELIDRGWLVRGTTRSATSVGPIEAAGIEAAIADPDRPGTVLDLVGDVAAVIWLLGSAAGPPESLAAIHGTRLERLLEKLVDTPVRAFAYEAAGTAGEGTLRCGREIVERAAGTWHIRTAILGETRSGPGWAPAAATSLAGLLS